jgi:outer membrane protein OmpA-like peptidoglycan-associated protein
MQATVTRFATRSARLAAAAVVAMAPWTYPVLAQAFDGGWTLEKDASSLTFQSVKNSSVVETSGFAEFEGTIAPDGTARVRIFLDSVDTKIDLRNVRMRFLFFETFQFPEAVVTAALDAAALSDLREVRRKIIRVPYTLELRGEARQAEADLAVTLIDDDLVAVSNVAPVVIPVADFGLEGGVKKLEEAANVVIVPSASVSFDFVFRRSATGTGTETASAGTRAPASTALEAAGDLTPEACVGRFEILSRTDNIYFASGSARLDPRSAPLLDSLVDIIARCPGLVIEVSGHTDSDGSDAANLRLSERRAAAVTDYLVARSIPADRVVSVGYGEARPVASNATAEGKSRNRRIEFAVLP